MYRWCAILYVFSIFGMRPPRGGPGTLGGGGEHPIPQYRNTVASPPLFTINYTHILKTKPVTPYSFRKKMFLLHKEEETGKIRQKSVEQILLKLKKKEKQNSTPQVFFFINNFDILL